MNFEGVVIGIFTLLIIGLLHPVVIKTEYYLGTKVWPVFLFSGIACTIASLFIVHTILSVLLAVLGFSLWWSILELFHQEKRVSKGWFPSNPRKQLK